MVYPMQTSVNLVQPYEKFTSICPPVTSYLWFHIFDFLNQNRAGASYFSHLNLLKSFDEDKTCEFILDTYVDA